MARPRTGDFTYHDAELAELRAAVVAAREAGGAGVVFGVLRADLTVDAGTVRDLVHRAEGLETVFHRAFDQTPNVFEALDTLIACGVTRVLTSGKARTAVDGTTMLAALVSHAAGRVEIMAGGGVRETNVVTIVRRSGVSQVHARGTEARVIAGIAGALTARTSS
jgi:copper homeostasis protein